LVHFIHVLAKLSLELWHLGVLALQSLSAADWNGIQGILLLHLRHYSLIN